MDDTANASGLTRAQAKTLALASLGGAVVFLISGSVGRARYRTLERDLPE